jgi:hypothetical protein
VDQILRGTPNNRKRRRGFTNIPELTAADCQYVVARDENSKAFIWMT